MGCSRQGQPAQGPAPALGSPAQGVREARVALLLGTSSVPGACAYGLAVPSPCAPGCLSSFPDEVCKAPRGEATSPRPNHWQVATGPCTQALRAARRARADHRLPGGALAVGQGPEQTHWAGNRNPSAQPKPTPQNSQRPGLLCSPQLPALVLGRAQETFPNKLVSQ